MNQTSNNKLFSLSEDEIKQLAEKTIARAVAMGASEATVNISEGMGLAVNVRGGNPEQSEYSHDKSLGISLAINQKNGAASTSDLSPQAIEQAINAALNFAKYTSVDEFSGLPEKAQLTKVSEFRELDVFHPWDLSMEQATEICREHEALAMKQDEKIIQCEGFQLSSSMSQGAFANSLGLVFSAKSSYHNIGCALIAQDELGMQRDAWFEESRLPLEQTHFNKAAVKAAERTVRRLSPKRISTGKFPVMFESTIAPTLIQLLVQALSGSALYRKTTFLPDSLGKQVLPTQINIYEDPFMAQGFASKNCDGEGVAVKARDWILNGVIQGYFLSSYSARKLKMQTTGNAGGAHNLIVNDNKFNRSANELIKHMNTGFIVTETLGHGVNMLTGDYSVGAVGFWVENGAIAHPVEEVTIAGNIKDMLAGIVGISNDGVYRGGIKCGAILLEEMTIAGQ